MDALSIPLWSALAVCGGIVTTSVGIVVWVFMTFERKVDAERLEVRVSSQDRVMMQVAQDVSYIRGMMQHKG